MRLLLCFFRILGLNPLQQIITVADEESAVVPAGVRRLPLSQRSEPAGNTARGRRLWRRRHPEYDLALLIHNQSAGRLAASAFDSAIDSVFGSVLRFGFVSARSGAGLEAGGGTEARLAVLHGLPVSRLRPERSAESLAALVGISSGAAGSWAPDRLNDMLQPTRPTIQPSRTARAMTATVRAPVR